MKAIYYFVNARRGFACAAALSVMLATLPTAWADADVEASIRRVIDGYYYAIGENRLKEAMAFYHADSPQRESTRQTLFDGESSYLQRTSTLELQLVQRNGQSAVAVVNHRHLRISGVKFMETFTRARYHFRRQGGAWKIWSSSEWRVRRRAPAQSN